MSNTDETNDEGKFFTAPVVQKSTNYPLAEFVIAALLGIDEFTEDNEEECLRRTKAVFELYDQLGIPLVYFKDETPFAARYVNRALIRRHRGQRTDHRWKTPEEFDKHLKLTKATRTGKLSRSCHRVLRTGSALRLEEPWVVYQEIDDHSDTEIRRVELYPDGRMLWHDDDAFEPGTATKEWVETAEIPLLSVRNSAAFREVTEVPAEEFEKLWNAARKEGCKWPVDLRAPRPWLTIEQTETVYCAETQTTDDGSAFCTEHREMAGRVFPALFHRA
ncbi:DUF6881 domain-containing protein [Streptomyces sp. HMX87]|uniref:DUF6881 domain-containing protein n=1 Tax=Streptomyces sp. HMX87 TaxID=3390849 RepID=UPI003A878EC2